MFRGILPRQLLEVVVPPRAVGGADEAHPVDHRAVRRCGREAIGLADNPCRQHAAAAAAGDKHVALVNEALLQQLVDAAHQVVVILARIGVVDLVAERAAVARAAARVAVEHHVAVGGMLLPSVVEADAVHAVRPAVDMQLHRVLPGGIEPRRRDVPALDLQTVRRRVGDLFHVAKLLALEDVVVDPRQLPDVLRRREVVGHDVARRLERRRHPDRLAALADARRGQHVRALRHLLHGIATNARHRQHVQVLNAGVLRGEVEARAVGLPLQPLRRAIPIARDQVRIAAVDVHDVDLAVGPRVAGGVESRVGHELAVG